MKTGARGTVILVHGVWMTGLELQWMARGLRRAGYRVYTFRYPSLRRGLAGNAALLAAFVARIPQEDAPLHFLGHSLGGLVIRRMLENHRSSRFEASRFLASGTPFMGSRTAEVLLNGSRLGAYLVGRCFVPALPAEEPPPASWTLPQALGIIAGTYPFGVGRLFTSLPLPNDGVVTVRETMLPGATDHCTLPVNHTALTFAPAAIRQATLFLDNGRFGSKASP